MITLIEQLYLYRAINNIAIFYIVTIIYTFILPGHCPSLGSKIPLLVSISGNMLKETLEETMSIVNMLNEASFVVIGLENVTVSRPFLYLILLLYILRDFGLPSLLREDTLLRLKMLMEF